MRYTCGILVPDVGLWVNGFLFLHNYFPQFVLYSVMKGIRFLWKARGLDGCYYCALPSYGFSDLKILFCIMFLQVLFNVLIALMVPLLSLR